MNFRRFARLSAVLLLPLLGLGVWLADEEAVFRQTTWVECNDAEVSFNCVSVLTTRSDSLDRYSRGGGVFVLGARLDAGFDHSVVVYDGADSKYSEGVGYEVTPLGSGVRKRLQIDRNVGADYDGKGPCNLRPYAGNDGVWSLSCGQWGSTLKFQEEEDSKKFAELAHVVKEINRRARSNSQTAYVASVVLPVAVFLVLSGALFLLMRTARFVWFGRESV